MRTAAEAFFGKPIEKITAPEGGKGERADTFSRRNKIIASWRAAQTQNARLREIRILE